MAFEFRQSDLEDPLRDIALLSLLPRTLGVGLQAEVSTSAVDELGSIQNFFKSMELKESRKVLEQAQAINNRYHNSQSFELKEKDVVANGEDVKDHQQGRRPGLGRKRAKFSMEPMQCSLPTVDFSSLDHIDDPEEYFLAYEQLENADKELKKLRGEVATDQTHHQWSTTARIRRPGIPGRRSYKERLSKADMIEAFRVTSPDKGIATSSNTPSASALNATLHSETTNQPGISHIIGVNIESCDAIERGSIAEEEKKVEGSIAKVEKTVEGLLDNLLSAFKDDEGEGEALLRKSLQFKSIDVGKVCLTEWNNTQRNDHKILDNEVLDPSMSSTHTKSPLYAISAYRKSIPVFVPLPWEEEPSHLMSPSDDESDSGGLYRSMSEVKRSTSSSANINQDTTSPLAEGAPVMVNGERSQIGDKIPLPLVEDSNIENNITSAEDLTKPYPQEDGIGQNSCAFDIQERDAFAGVDDALEEEGNDRQPDALMFPQSDHEIEDPPSNCLNQNEGFTISPSRVNDKTTSIENDVGVRSFEFEINLESGVNPVAQGEPVSNAEVSYDSSGPSRAVLTVDGHSNNLSNSQVENNEAEGLQENPGQILSGRRKKKAPTNGQNKKKTVSKRKDLTRKQSLSGAGLAWKSGVRRSTRIKSRPLEYWRGERFLYGRIHDSLATVIGVKYASPVKGAKSPVLKVKSYVDKKYADLIALAASQ